ncbi:hypothetical protein LTR08_009240 [Meristemomyces frigidus]|nr:hypothetical protein LTR08_009240 [Meristemomyces frigidus]
MSGLVGYGSSDDDDDNDDLSAQRPAKKPKLDDARVQVTNADVNGHIKTPAQDEEQPAVAPLAEDTASKQSAVEPLGPTPGPSAAPSSLDQQPAGPALTASDPQLSPYTYERQRLRELTMPSVPNFDIPDSPPPPTTNSEEAATLAATSKKFERFLELKSQGVHFNERLQNSSSLRNPGLLPKLMAFAGINEEESYASTLPEGLAVPVKWGEGCYVESLLKQAERSEKKRLAERGKVDFVGAAKSAVTSASTTPSNGGAAAGAKESRRSRFDRR